jgi:serine/threonine protein kinase
VLRGGRATAASDVFAFGCVLWELLAWQLPWGRQSPFAVGAGITQVTAQWPV